MAVLNIVCVLKSGGSTYNTEYVRKLRDGVHRHLKKPHRFACLSDVEVPCERIPLIHDWPGWWSKVELYRPGLFEGPVFYLDLDTIVVNRLDAIYTITEDQAVLDIRGNGYAQTGAMYFNTVPYQMYEHFAPRAEELMQYYKQNQNGQYIGDQGLWKDVMGHGGRRLTEILPGFFRSYKLHCKRNIPEGTSVVCFHGLPRPADVKFGWVKKLWN